jgi:hypothetical protein
MKLRVMVMVLFASVAACSAAPGPREQGAAGETGETPPTSTSVTVGPIVDRALPLEEDGEPCGADDECASGSCNEKVGACRASPDATCAERVGCAGDLVCAPACPAASCGGPRCREVVKGVTCASDRDCEKGAACAADHLCKWPRGGRCDPFLAWCAGGEVCCPEAHGARCTPKKACDHAALAPDTDLEPAPEDARASDERTVR